MQHEGPALADERRPPVGLVPVTRELFLRDEPRIVSARPRNHAHAVGAEKDRTAVRLFMSLIDPHHHLPGPLAALLGLAHAPWNEHHGPGRVTGNDLLHQLRNLSRAHGHDQQVELVRQARQIRHAQNPACIRSALAQNRHIFRGKALGQHVVQNDPPEIPARGRDPDNADALRMQQVVDLAHRPARWLRLRQREAAHAVKGHHQVIGKGKGIDFQLFDDEGRSRVGRGIVVGHGHEALEALDELFVADDTALATGQPGQFLVRDGLAEELEKGLAVGHFRGRGHNGLPFAEPLRVELRIRAAEARAQNHAEFAGPPQADDQLMAESVGIRRHELDLQHALQIAADGRNQSLPRKPPVRRGSSVRMTLDPGRVILRHFVKHAPLGRADVVRRLGHDAHPAHLGLVHDRRGDDLEDCLVAGHGGKLFVRRPGPAHQQVGPRRSLGPGFGQQGIDFVFVQKIAALGMGFLQQGRDGLEIDVFGGVHGWSFKKKRRAEARQSWL